MCLIKWNGDGFQCRVQFLSAAAPKCSKSTGLKMFVLITRLRNLRRGFQRIVRISRMKKLCRCYYLTADSADNADISRRMGAPAPSPESLSRRFLFCGGNTIREGGFTIHLLDGAGAPSYFFSRILLVEKQCGRKQKKMIKL